MNRRELRDKEVVQTRMAHIRRQDILNNQIRSIFSNLPHLDPEHMGVLGDSATPRELVYECRRCEKVCRRTFMEHYDPLDTDLVEVEPGYSNRRIRAYCMAELLAFAMHECRHAYRFFEEIAGTDGQV